MYLEEYQRRGAEVIGAMFMYAAQIGQTTGWAYARAIPELNRLGKEYADTAYREHVERMEAK